MNLRDKNFTTAELDRFLLWIDIHVKVVEYIIENPEKLGLDSNEEKDAIANFKIQMLNEVADLVEISKLDILAPDAIGKPPTEAVN